jgi:CBS domain-containing protein
MEAARQMLDHSVGSLVITEPSGATPLGIVTDRDLMLMIAEGLDPSEATVTCLAQPPLETVLVTDSLQEVTHRMRKHGVRRLPIVDSETRLVGIVSIDDVLLLLGHEMSNIAAAIETGLKHERGMPALRARSQSGTG